MILRHFAGPAFPRGAPSLMLLLLAASVGLACLPVTAAPRDGQPKRAAAPRAAAPRAAAPRQDFPFPFDPQVMLERFLGEEREEDKQALARIEISAREEQQLGNQVVQAYLADLKRRNLRVVSRGAEVDYLRRLVETLRPAMRNGGRYRALQIYLVDSPEVDARCFAGGTLVFFRGLLEFAESEAALVGIIGHELSHLDRGHQLVHARRLKLAQQTFSGRGQQVSFEQFMNKGSTLMRAFMRPFRPADEAEADLDGATWAYRAGYDPREMARLFLRLHQRDAGQAAPVPLFFRTHPFHIDRYQAILQRYEELAASEPNDALYIGRGNLEQRVTRAQRELP